MPHQRRRHATWYYMTMWTKRCLFLALHLKITQENCSKKTKSRRKAGRDCSVEVNHPLGRAHNCFSERLRRCCIKLKHYKRAVLRELPIRGEAKTQHWSSQAPKATKIVASNPSKQSSRRKQGSVWARGTAWNHTSLTPTPSTEESTHHAQIYF